MTPLLAGLCASVCVPSRCSRSRCCATAGRSTGSARAATGDRDAEGSALRRLVEWLRGRLGPGIAPADAAPAKRESIDRRLDLAGRPGGMTVQRFVGYKAALR